MPAPSAARLIGDVKVVGKEVWILEYRPSGGSVATWHVLDPRKGTLVARLRLPTGWDVLGGSGTDLYVRRRDAMDVEYLAIHSIHR